MLAIDHDHLDSTRFERLLAVGRQTVARGDLDDGIAAYQSALNLWRGEALADFAAEAWARPAAARLDELRLVALEERVDAELASGR